MSRVRLSFFASDCGAIGVCSGAVGVVKFTSSLTFFVDWWPAVSSRVAHALSSSRTVTSSV